MKLLIAFLLLLFVACKKEPVNPTPETPKPVAEFLYVMNYPGHDDDVMMINNLLSDSLSLGGFTVGNKANPTAYTIPNSVRIGKGRGYRLTYKMFNFEIGDSTDVIYLKNKEGVLQDEWKFIK